MSELTRRDAMKLTTAGAVLAVGATTARAQDKEPVSTQQYWDCIVNSTGKTLLVTLASGNAGGPGYLLSKDQSLPFPVRKTTKKMVYVAYESGTDVLVKMEEFPVLHQQYPPTNCLHITSAEAAKRVKGEAPTAKTTPPAAPLPY